MRTQRSLARRAVAWLLIVAVGGATLFFGAQVLGATESDAVGAALDRARSEGSYRFASDVEQVVSPAASAKNAGRSSRTEKLRLEGSADLDGSETEFALWSGPTADLDDAPSVGFRVADGRTFQRQGRGEWVESGGGEQPFAPQGDMLSYLVGARDAIDLGPGSSTGANYLRYGFEIDGPSFAAAVASEMEASTRDRGELPLGARVSVPAQFRDMTGTGELWVDESTGLPVRQILSLQFPPTQDETTTAQITTDFTDFGYASVTTSTSGMFDEVSLLLAGLVDVAQVLGPIVVVLALIAVGWRRRRDGVVVGIGLVVVIGTLVGGPLGDAALASTAVERADASSPRSPGTAVDQDDHAELVARLSRQASTYRPETVDPHVDRHAMVGIKGSPGYQADPGTDTDGDGLSDDEEAELETDPGLVDTDGDSLSDFEEVQIGIDPRTDDTDGDGYTDDVELDGFMLPGETTVWYPDPANPDSNEDGIADSIEWDVTDTGNPADTDGNGVPDLFDEDNDGDGVPDHKDLAPFTHSDATFGQNDPLELQIDGLDGDLPTFVDFQLRPSNPEHLRYALRPLDWPTDDLGQIRDVDGSADDLSLVPMLEIRFPTGSDVVPDSSVLDPYSVRLNDATDPDMAFVPLSLVTDQRTGEDVAFHGQMRYQSPAPGRTWGVHQVRMVWAVRVDNDTVCDPASTSPDPLPSDPGAAVEAVCGADGYIYNRPQTVHSYYSDWTLTGLEVTEEHGVDTALIYEDPAVDDDALEPGPTWAIADVLSQRFLTARPDAGGNFEYEFDVAGLGAFDHTSGATEADRYGLPDIFSVISGSSGSFDEALRATTETIYDTVLDEFGDPGAWSAANSVMPLVMTAYSTQSRVLTTDSDRVGNGTVAWSGTRLELDLGTGVPLDQSSGITWSSFCGGTASSPVWSRCDIGQVADRLEDRYHDVNVDPDDPTEIYDATANGPLDPDVVRGQDLVMMAYYLALANGVSTVVTSTDDSGVGLNIARYGSDSDEDLEQVATIAAQGAKKFAQYKFNQYLEGSFKFFGRTPGTAQARNVYKILGEQGTVSTLKRLAPKGGLGKGLLVAAVVTAVVAVGVAVALALDGDPDAQVALKVVAGVAGIVASLAIFIPFVNHFRAYYSGVAGLMTLMGKSTAYLQVTAKATFVGTVIVLGVVWGFFINSMVSDGIRAGSPAFNQALSLIVASTIYIVLLAVLTLTVGGALLVAVVSAIDGILSLICEVGSDSDRAALEVDGQCFTIGGSFIAGVAELLYSYHPLIDLGRDDLVVTDVPENTPMFQLADASRGYVVGNQLDVTLDVTTNLGSTDPDDLGFLVPPWFFSIGLLRSSAFEYSLTAPSSEDLSARRGDMRDDWVDEGARSASETRRVSASSRIVLQPAGINGSFDYHLNMGYATPAVECWYPYITPPICDVETLAGSTSTAFDPVRFDVLPATIDDFLTTVPTAGGHRFAWDERFGAIADLDGDGLLAADDGGLDPDDTRWDTDSDGLSDAYEAEQREAGTALSDVSADTDGDGLLDGQELALRTDPAVQDTDGDGLSDAEEVRHMTLSTGSQGPEWNRTGGPQGDGWSGGWDIVIDLTGRVAMVSSDPLVADSDLDGVDDEAERALAQAGHNDENGRAFHPLVPNAPPLTATMTTNDADGYVRPGQELVVDTAVEATVPIAPSVIDVDVPFWQADPLPSRLEFDPDTFDGSQTVTHRETVTVPDSQSTDFTVAADVRGRLVEPDRGPELRLDTRTAMNAALPNGGLDVAPVRADRRNRFAFVDEGHTGSGRFGSVWTRVMGAISPHAELDDDEDTTRTPAKMDWRQRKTGEVANDCNDTGSCMTTWSYAENCMDVTINSVKVLDVSDQNNNVEIGMYLSRSGSFDHGSLEPVWHSVKDGPGSMADEHTQNIGARSRVCAHGYLAVIETDGETREDLVGCDAQPASQTNCKQLRVVPDGSSQLEGMRELTLMHGSGDSPKVGTHDVVFQFSDCSSHCDRVRVNYTLTAGWLENPTQPVGNGQIDKLAAAVTGGPSAVTTSQFDVGPDIGPGVHDFSPAIASNGDRFLVVWTRTKDIGGGQVEVRFVRQVFYADGSPRSAAEVYEAPFVQSASAAVPALDVYWAPNRRPVVVVNRPHVPTWGTVIGLQYATTDANDAIDIAGDPHNGDVVAVYESVDGIMATRFLAGPSSVSAVTSNRVMMLDPASDFTSLESPQVALDPETGGWVISARHVGTGKADVVVGRYGNSLFLDTSRPRNSNSAPAVPNELLTMDTVDAVRQALTCESPASAPVAELRFEELPGATEFADSSRQGNHGTVGTNSLPGAGFAPAPGAPDSNFAAVVRDYETIALPNEVGQDVSLAFWVRRDDTNPFTRFLSVAGPGGHRLGVYNHYVTYSADSSGVGVTGNGNGGSRPYPLSGLSRDWHHIVVSASGSAGTASLYVDGQAWVQDGATGTPTDGPLSIVGDGVELDHFQMFDRALAPDEVTEIYAGTSSGRCVVVAAERNSATFPWAELQLEPHDPVAMLLASARVNLRVDETAPTTSVVAIPGHVAGSSTGEPATVIVSGTATDGGAGVSRVEVSVDRGPWVPANGQDTWTFPLEVADGPYEVRARAVDAAGNTGFYGTITVVADGVAPDTTLDAPSTRPIAPGLDGATGRALVPMSGTATDGGSGIAGDAVEVQLLPSPSDGQVAETAWQRADLVGDDWSLDYEFSSTAVDVSGPWDIRVRSTDQVGNVSSYESVVGTVLLDANAPEAVVGERDVERRMIGGDDVWEIAGQVTDSDGAGVDQLEVALTPLETILALPDGASVDDLPTPPTWTAATLADRGDGVTETTWSFPFASGIEGVFQVDVRTTDMLGNQAVRPNVWRGIVDTRAPRLALVTDPTGDAHSAETRFEVSYHCTAEDRFLDDDAFVCHGESDVPAVHHFADDPAIQAEFPDLAALDEISTTFTRWERSPGVAVTFAACDLVGNCATERRDVDDSGTVSHPLSATVAAPTDGAHVAMSEAGTVGVSAFAEGAGSIRSLVVLVDGLETDRREFAEGEASVFGERIDVPVAGGDHTVELEVTDWSGTTASSGPVGFFADAHDPFVSFESDEITAADTWGPGSEMIRFRGAVTDDGTIVSVEVKVDDGEWTDVLFDDAEWRGALHVPDADGKDLTVQVRATDLAGRSTVESYESAVDLSPDAADFERPDSTITDGPAPTGPSTSATFDITTIEGTNEIGALTCVVDGLAPITCSSPWTVSDLSAGQHLLEVTAFDIEGNEDLTPATWAWTVEPSEPTVLLLSGPDDPTSERSAEFAYVAPTGATVECSLDGGGFEECADPVRYDDLADGTHRFEIRATLSGTTGTAVARKWTIVNTAPVASDQFVTYVPSPDETPITLEASDEDHVTYRVVSAPLHGVLDGSGEARTYVPFPGHGGPDEFSFQAFDGAAWSNVAIVSLASRTPEITWDAPAAITYGDLLTDDHLDAAASVPGTFIYEPEIDVLLPAGVHTLSATFTPADSTLYDVTEVTTTIEVVPAPLTITASSVEHPHGTPPPSITPEYDGFVADEGPADLDVGPTCASDSDEESPAGTYASTCEGASDPDYDIGYEAGRVTVTPASTSLDLEDVDFVDSVKAGSVTFVATLTSNATGLAVPGQEIEFFFADGSPACTSRTGADGRATCSAHAKSMAKLLLMRSFRAEYDGAADFESSTATGAVVLPKNKKDSESDEAATSPAAVATVAEPTLVG